ncbi:hypothetical protein, partial [Streptomyces lydicus]
MTHAADGPLQGLAIDHIGFAVRDLAEAAEPFTARYGFGVLAGPDAVGTPGGGARSLAVGAD